MAKDLVVVAARSITGSGVISPGNGLAFVITADYRHDGDATMSSDGKVFTLDNGMKINRGSHRVYISGTVTVVD